MRISSILAVAVATLAIGASSSAFAAPSGSIAPSSQANTVLVNASSHSLYKLNRYDAEHMVGTFQLDDGRLLVLSHKGSTLFAEFDGKREELVPVSGDSFVSRDSGAKLTFDRVPFGALVTLDQAK